MIIDKRTLGTPIAEGGEGRIYKKKGQIYKIFKDTVDLKAKEQKVNTLIGLSLPPSIVKPEEPIFDAGKNFIGYVMRDLKDIDEFRQLANRKTLQSYGLKLPDVLRMVLYVRDSVLALHAKQIYVGDLNDSNVVFNSGFDVFLLDTDSWSIGNNHCTVAMDSFKDPLLHQDNFNETTDAYAFAILAFKSITRLHPFGGTLNPDVDMLERMRRGMSVLNPKLQITIPRIIDPWTYMSPDFIADLASIFDQKKRFVVQASLNDFAGNLKNCVQHGNFYYAHFDKCPVCFNAKLQTPAKQQVASDGMPIYVVFRDAQDVLQFLSETTYLDNNKNIVHLRTLTRVPHQFGQLVYFTNAGEPIIVKSEEIRYNDVVLPKQNKTRVVSRDKKLYYINPSLELTEATLDSKGTGMRKLAKVFINNVFEIATNGKFFICNMDDSRPVFNINGHYYEHDTPIHAVNYGIHYDEVKDRWLFIYETKAGGFITMVFENNTVLFFSTLLKYDVPLESLMIRNNVIFEAQTGRLHAFNWKTNNAKDFICAVTEEGAMLRPRGNKILVINEKEIYEVG